jgi:aryl-alcohol dehydrogenase-like predicted oxidoreductase
LPIPRRKLGKTGAEISALSENWLGRGIKGRRDRVFLMTKVCTHGRPGALGLQMLEQSLRRLGTDHLDLWQIYAVCFDNDRGAMETSEGYR